MIAILLAASIAALIATCAIAVLTAPLPRVIPAPSIDIQDDMVIFDFGVVQVIRSYTLESDGESWAVFWTDLDVTGEDCDADPFIEVAHIDDEAILDYHSDSLREADHYRREGDYGYHGVRRDEF